MRKPYRLLGLGLLVGLSLLAGCGGGGGDKSSTPTKVGSATCTDACHATTKDITGTQIAAAWANTTHTTDGNVQCEDCHGAGSLHMGVGNIPYPNPQAAQCEVCHTDKKGFDSTRHANSNPYNGTNPGSFTGPDKFFFQGDALNSGIAEIMRKPEFFPDGVTPVTHAQHIEECSRCHNPNQRFEYGFADASGPLIVPDPNNMPDPPNIACAGCHDAHQPETKVKIAQRKDAVPYPLFRKFFVNPTGEQNDNIPGTQFAASIYQPNGAVQPDGTVDYSKVVGKNNEIHLERLCASCHTKGKYKYSQLATHQTDVYTQWLNSGHGDRSGPPFAEFSANPPAYTSPEGTPYEIGTHRATWPFDMALSTAGTTASTSQNGGYIPAGSTNVANGYACYKCHNGLTSLAYQNNVEGTPAAPVVFGDVPVTCVTCHDPHSDVAGQSKNTRKPQIMTKYNAGGLVFSGNVFLDNTPVPGTTGNATICVFCHQGRESGYTLFKRRLAADSTLTGNFLNEHYLGTGGMLWGRNAYEYGGKQYGENVFHQQTNCIGCHMSDSGRDDIGGHSWRIFSLSDGKVNNASCNVSSCHNGRVPGTRDGLFTFRDTTFDPSNDYDGNGKIEGLPVEIANLCIQLRDLLQVNGVFYNDLRNPYFFISAAADAPTFTAWTQATLKAAFNLQYVIKGLPSAPESQMGKPNPSAATHNFRYNIQLLRDSYDDLQKSGVSGQPNRSSQPRPAGSRPATNYDPQPGGGYNPRQ